MAQVQQLSKDELNELRESYFYNESVIHFYRNTDDIPNEVLFSHYEGISFVEEDFFCNL